MANDLPPKRKPKTPQQLRAAIAAVMDDRSIAASQSQYDAKVCVRAVGAARDVFENVPLEGTAIEYGQAVVAVLGDLRDRYNDSDGEYTSGKAPIGDVCYDVSSLVADQMPPGNE